MMGLVLHNTKELIGKPNKQNHTKQFCYSIEKETNKKEKTNPWLTQSEMQVASFRIWMQVPTR